MSNLSRRKFLKSSAAVGTLAMAGCSQLTKPAERGANEKIRVAVAGIHGRGTSHIGAFSGMENVEVVYLVDPDSRLFESRIKQAQGDSKGRSNPTCVQDIRKVLEDDSIDVVSIATPNHWHSLITIWACQAGKDVYVEKPMSHNIWEGRKVVEAAKKYKCIVQHGTQRRSENGWNKVIAAIHSGELGKLKIARGLCYKPGGRGSIGFKPQRTPPAELDFNMWLGPADNQPYHDNLVHYKWHWFWDFGNGDLGNQGVHQMDVARWGIKGATLPKSMISFGGRLGYYDQGEVASTQMAVMDFGETKLIFETRGLPSEGYEFLPGKRAGGVSNVFHLEGGTIVEHDFYDEKGKKAPLPDVEFEMGPGGGNFGNFMAAVRSRKTSDLNADALEGHYSSACCHLCNMSIRTGQKVPYSPQSERLSSCPDTLDVLERMEAYLAKNGVKLEESGYIIGRELTIDAKAEKTNDAEANALLSRPYRQGFVVPMKV